MISLVHVQSQYRAICTCLLKNYKKSALHNFDADKCLPMFPLSPGISETIRKKILAV